MFQPLYFTFQLLRADYLHWPFPQMIWPVAPILQATQATLKLTHTVDSGVTPDFTAAVQGATSVAALATYFLSQKHWALAPVVDVVG